MRKYTSNCDYIMAIFRVILKIKIFILSIFDHWKAFVNGEFTNPYLNVRKFNIIKKQKNNINGNKFFNFSLEKADIITTLIFISPQNALNIRQTYDLADWCRMKNRLNCYHFFLSQEMEMFQYLFLYQKTVKYFEPSSLRKTRNL